MERNLQCPSKHRARWIPASVNLAAVLSSHQNILTAGICLVQECASNKQGAHLRLLGLLNITSGALFWTNTHFSEALLAQAQRRGLGVMVVRPQKCCCTQGMKEAHHQDGTLHWSNVQGLSHRKWHLWLESAHYWQHQAPAWLYAAALTWWAACLAQRGPWWRTAPPAQPLPTTPAKNVHWRFLECCRKSPCECRPSLPQPQHQVCTDPQGRAATGFWLLWQLRLLMLLMPDLPLKCTLYLQNTYSVTGSFCRCKSLEPTSCSGRPPSKLSPVPLKNWMWPGFHQLNKCLKILCCIPAAHMQHPYIWTP